MRNTVTNSKPSQGKISIYVSRKSDIPPKGVSSSDLIVTFAMSVEFDTYFDLQH